MTNTIAPCYKLGILKVGVSLFKFAVYADITLNVAFRKNTLSDINSNIENCLWSVPGGCKKVLRNGVF